MTELTSKHPDGAREHARSFIERRLIEGYWSFGTPIPAVTLADEIGMSPSPVREALATLHGEGAIEVRHRDGYSVPRLMPHELADEYHVLGILAEGVAPHVVAPPLTEAGVRAEPHARARRLVMAIATAAGSNVAAAIFERSALRLVGYQRLEPELFSDWEGELALLEALLAGGEKAPLRAALRRYYARRIKAAGMLSRLAEQIAKRERKAFE
ncbi:GntR family transcriptional regulator [Sphingomonas sp. M1-B02]|uniref:GntR family transcriptional regulator n=1 Tax=Sphingomonas sp. M1-B02 TaxID=3114300 RepID=UPI00224027B6|nr:GntR family transcriptional regulator [Sphingomonas sp. S6-11]UZK67851.1 GntR family transcriptional regulator [Sphingomonas sp. S6-11]